jgi:Mrp family chromosome partitioning ATPase
VLALLRDEGGAPEALLPVAVSLRRPVVLLTSPGPGEGATEVALGLTRAIDLTGRSAALVEADAASTPLPSLAARIKAARGGADIVLLVGPPAAVALADDVLVVARLDVTRTDELQRAVRVLAAAEAAPVGVVATTAPPRGPLRAALALIWPEWRRPETTSEVTVG